LDAIAGVTGMTCKTGINQAEIHSEVPKKFILHDRAIQANCINYLKSYHGKKIEVEIKLYTADQTDSQRGYFHWGCDIFAKAVGYTPGEIKQYIKEELWGTEEVFINGLKRPLNRTKSMAKGKTNKLDYSDAIECMLRLAAEAEVHIPDAVRQQ